MIFEWLALIAIIAFGLRQVGMMIASHYWFPRVQAWKNSLQSSHSMWAKLELIIFF